eukprot:CAMPEP_0197823860 /NCGR_PEP_ID=MMETSP1437-20131217/1173_1 /TAXON_ID=49252 ORGANISM="Eucampia antarctica, Strain CCMP1452" /NCGR_SAMPLE_ID=MMETSP1437 /ASSEMBLY_ACC=CAM_ASM_001096 /LENGTH=259 /DNA_ID=CAMNT_0043423235 /DNA_START=107 /DNA_END=886 /DNA_ORIENTATION=-
MSDKQWKVSVYFAHNEDFLGTTRGGQCHIHIIQVKPTESERHWISGKELNRDQVFLFQDVCKSLGLKNIGKGGTEETRDFLTEDPKKVNLALCMTKYAGQFGTSEKNSYGYRWWPADPEESIGTRKCWRVCVTLTAITYSFDSETFSRQVKVWVQQIRPKLEDRHFVASGTIYDEDKMIEYVEMVKKSPMEMVFFPLFGSPPGSGQNEYLSSSFNMSDSFETEDHLIVNKALRNTYYAGKFGSSEKTRYGYSWTRNKDN